MTDFQSELGKVEEALSKTAKGLFASIDRMSFKALINCLKSSDYEAVRTTLDQIAKEKKPISIPPVYLVAKSHPNAYARKKAEETLAILDTKDEIAKMTAGKNPQEAIQILVQHFGHF